jgi:ADP-ribose pyrophosphatase YjhB (NUDIX family)
MKNSCGGLLYAISPNGTTGIILGIEGNDWLPFKGCNEPNETFEQTAIREICEETCGIVQIKTIKLDHQFTSKRKNYYIGLVCVDYDIVNQFDIISKNENRIEYKEKKELRFFPLCDVLNDPRVHEISKASVRYYWNRLNTQCVGRKLSISSTFMENFKW